MYGIVSTAMPIGYLRRVAGVGTSPPTNLVLPVISGVLQYGATLSTTDGSWTNSPTSYTYQWYRAGVLIAGETASTHVVVDLDAGLTLTVVVTAHTAFSSASATSVGVVISEWLLLDLFTTSDPNPIVTPRTCEPGPGILTIVDPSNKLSISSTAMQIASGTSAWDTGFYRTLSIPRVVGRGLITTFAQSFGTTFNPVMWSRSAAIVNGTLPGGADHTYRAFGAGHISYINGTPIIGDDLGTAAGIILRAAGAFYVQHFQGEWLLEWVDNAQNTASLFAECANNDSTGSVADFSIIDFPSPWNTAYGLATSYVASTVNGEVATMTADAIVEHTITAVTGVTQEVILRMTDVDNCWILRMSQVGSTVKLIQRVAGVETERSSVAHTFTNGTQYRVVALCRGFKIRTYIGSVLKASYTAATFNQTATNLMVSHAGTNLAAWPHHLVMPDFLDDGVYAGPEWYAIP